jgi:hypothetical protein
MLRYLIIISCLIGWSILFFPVLFYLFKSWKIKFDNIKAVFPEKSLKVYFQQFFPSIQLARTDLRDQFEKHFHQRYGRRRYTCPLVLLGATSVIGFILVTNNLLYWLKEQPFFNPVPEMAITSFLGAYMWIVYDQIKRCRKFDFTPHDVYMCSYRFLIAVPLGFSMAYTVKEPLGIPLSFLLGAFPTDTLHAIGRRFVAQKLGMGEQDETGKSELEKLQSINRAEAERYSDEGITNILQLAYSNPIDVSLRTNFDFNYVVDCISQALLWLYLGDKVRQLYSIGLRGAQEVYVFRGLLADEDKDAQKVLQEAATIMNISEDSLRQTLFNVAEDPYTQFICEVWC